MKFSASIPLPFYLFLPKQLIGIFINWGLLGALIVQVFLYQQEFKNDRKWIKCLGQSTPTPQIRIRILIPRVVVYGLFILEIVQTALCTADAVKWFAIGYGNVIALSKPEFSTIDAPVLDAIIALVVQLTFCWRIKVSIHLYICVCAPRNF